MNKIKLIFLKVTKLNVKKVIDYLETSKATTYEGIPAKVLKENSYIYLHKLTDMIYNTINTSNKENYRPVSNLLQFLQYMKDYYFNRF